MHTTSGMWKLAILVCGVTSCSLISTAWSQIEGGPFEAEVGDQSFQYLQPIWPGTGMSSEFQVNPSKWGSVDALLRVREAQMRNAASVLSQQSEAVTHKQLSDPHWQESFVDKMPLDHPLRRSATAWWQQNGDVALPPTFFSTMSDSDYRIEWSSKYRDSFEEPAEVGPPRAAWDGRDKMEVDAGEAAKAILAARINPGGTRFKIDDEKNAAKDDIRDDAEQIRACSAAVKMLRAPFEQTGKNVLDHFDQICLFESSPRILEDTQRKQVIECLDLYVTYDEACFYERYDNAEAALAPLGVLFKAGGQLPTTIHCMAYRVSKDILLTARHCLDDDVMLDSYSLRDNVLYFQPLRHHIDLEEMISMAQPLGRPAGCSIVHIVDPANFDLRAEVPPVDEIDPENDIVLLQMTSCPTRMLDEGKTAQQLKLRVDATPKAFEPLILAGFNDMAFRIALLRARLEGRKRPGDLELLVEGSWRRFVRQDESAVCRVGSIDSPLRQWDPSPRQVGHYCQTQPGMSGAPLIAMRNVTGRQGRTLKDREDTRLDSEPVLVGIHRRAPGMDTRLNGNIPERNGPPNAGISLGEGVSANLTKLIH